MDNLKKFGKYLITPQPLSPLAVTINLVTVGVLIASNGYEIYRDYKKTQEEKNLAK